MTRIALLIEWDEPAAMDLAEVVWNAGGTVRLVADTALGEERVARPESWIESQEAGV